MPPDLAAGRNGHDPEHSARSPVFILTASRSGSTLLRFILDSHPDLACPPETSIAAAAAALLRSWDSLDRAGSASTPVTGPAPPSEHMLADVRETIDRMYVPYLRRRGKRRWCDKSLDTHQYADLITVLYPDAQFICLYRHCMDVIASGVEVCPWGLHRHGFDPFVAQNPGNSVTAIGSYWLETVQAIMNFEESHPRLCRRVRYEDLVAAPEESAAEIFAFLGAEPVPGIARASFQIPHEENGAGDEKIWFTSDVTPASVGRGFRVPAAGLAPPLRQAINMTLDKLGYRPVDDQWDSQTGPRDPRADLDHAIPAADGRQPALSAPINAVADAIAARVTARLDGHLHEVIELWPVLAGGTVAVVIQADGGQRRQLRWKFASAQAPDASGTDDEPVASIIADQAVWRALLDRSTNIISELTAGRVRCVNKRDAHRIRSDELHAVCWLLDLTQIPFVRTEVPAREPA
jgi:hypothetical protein